MKTKSTLFCLVFAVFVNTSIIVYAQAVNKQDSLALVDFQNSANGPEWILTDPVSTWGGVTVTDTRVTGLDLGDRFLEGTISPSIGNITELEMLNLSGNRLSGSIPSSIGNLTKLASLNLSSNFGFNGRLGGNIPSSIGNLTNLNSLDLHDNELTA